MNKNVRILSIALILTCLFCFTSCELFGKNADLDKLSELIKSQVSDYTVRVSVTSGNGLTSTEEYTVREVNGARTVSYRIEKLNGFTVNGDTVTPPEEFKTVSEGTLTGADALSPKFDLPSFNFSADVIKNVRVAETAPLQLTAELSSLEGFMGKALSGSNATLTVVYTDSAINSISVSYTTDAGNTCTVVYTFN